LDRVGLPLYAQAMKAKCFAHRRQFSATPANH